MVRALFIAALFFTVTPVLVALQWLLEQLRLPGWGFIACNYYRLLRALLRIRLRVDGEAPRGRAMLFVSNHVSWADIVVIGSIAPVAFVAKSEVRQWPLVGLIARMQRTVFVDRARRHRTGDAIAEIGQRLAGGTSMVLFAEGTSSDGNRVLPFRSALVGAVKEAASRGAITVQPMSICYTAQHGIPLGRQYRPLVAWYGDLDFMPHIRAFIAQGAIDAVVSYGAPFAADADTDRKVMAKRLESAVRSLTSTSLRGRPPAAQAAE